MVMYTIGSGVVGAVGARAPTLFADGIMRSLPHAHAQGVK